LLRQEIWAGESTSLLFASSRSRPAKQVITFTLPSHGQRDCLRPHNINLLLRPSAFLHQHPQPAHHLSFKPNSASYPTPTNITFFKSTTMKSFAVLAIAGAAAAQSLSQCAVSFPLPITA
jgi:hypothetical protein